MSCFCNTLRTSHIGSDGDDSAWLPPDPSKRPDAGDEANAQNKLARVVTNMSRPIENVVVIYSERETVTHRAGTRLC